MQETKACVFCQVSSDERPLVVLAYQDKNYYICSEHLPLLIHQPEKLTGKLPGAEKLKGHSHD